jgi:hypothetical protein
MRNKLYLSLSLIFVIGLLSFPCAIRSALATDQDKEAKNGNNRISTKYDKGTNTTTVTLKSMALTGLKEERPQAQSIPKHQMDMDAFFTYPGEQMQKQVEEATFRFHATSGNYFYMRGQTVTAVLDKANPEKGRLLQLGTTDYKSSLKFNSVYEEIMTMRVPFAAIEKLIRGETIDVYVGPVPYTLKDSQIQDLRDFGSRMIPR